MFLYIQNVRYEKKTTPFSSFVFVILELWISYVAGKTILLFLVVLIVVYHCSMLNGPVGCVYMLPVYCTYSNCLMTGHKQHFAEDTLEYKFIQYTSKVCMYTVARFCVDRIIRATGIWGSGPVTLCNYTTFILLEMSGSNIKSKS